MQDMTIPNRVATNSIFLVRESLKQLRYHAERMTNDDSSIERVIRESDLLSTLLKRLEPFLETPQARVESKQIGTEIDIAALSRFLAAVETDDICPNCGGVKNDSYP